ncbi:MAG: hypothetical protein ABW101_15000 [Candidatus Thiodiazotropha sp.]
MDQTTLFLVLGGLLVLALVLASIAQRYNDYVEERRMQILRILHRVDELEAMVQRMAGLPLPLDAQRLIRQDIIERLKAALRIHAAYPGLTRRMREAESALEGIQAGPASFDLDALRLEQFTRLSGELLWMLQEHRLITPIAEDQRSQLMTRLNLGRADAMTRHHLREAQRLEQDAQLHQAHWHCLQLRHLLEPLAASHPEAAEWLQGSRELCQRIKRRIQDDQSSGGGSDSSSSSGSEMR